MNLNIQNSRLNIKFRVLHSDSISSSNDEHIARFIFKIWRIGAHLWQDFLTNLTQHKDSNGVSVGITINSEIVSSNHNQYEHLGCENVDDGKGGESGG